MKFYNVNKRWNYGRWVKHYRDTHPGSKAFRKRRGNSRGTHRR